MIIIQYGSQVYEVRVIPEKDLFHDGESHSGHISHNKSTIDISAEWDQPGRKVILWHELIHAILSHSGRDGTIDEAVIESLAHGIVEILQRNNFLFDAVLNDEVPTWR